MSKREIVINYVPGETCRVAVVEDGRMTDFLAERMDAVDHVGNIYVGRVVNIEPAIQAAFIDFGLEHAGFLHVSDLHPKYFPGEDDETTERVGKKTPRRDRPPIQQCLRRGQEIAVQVLKEGVGTKGPTLTSYLSIPGRFLVMMPQMDKVGVSRKVEDEEQRRAMRAVLDSLDLPEGFGFILRTAGMDRPKIELKRDLAYLLRLWKDMEARWQGGSKPRLLYSESDLLVRSLRDLLTNEVDRIVIDNEAALKRAARFLTIVAPRSATNLVHYTGRAPIFHAMDVEEQIQLMYAREVPLPSGGRLVIDETEALVAIDVNSGKMRDTNDPETTALRTNLEATDEICRQLRLRDLGGLVVNDLIDMRLPKNRRAVEQRFKDNLKRDRARTTILPISRFGILEMTRQRMRGSHESIHFASCPTCRGRGLVQKPESVAADAFRGLAALLDLERVKRLELVVGPRIAGELLSRRRRSLTRLEAASGKHVDVRVSEAMPVDRVTFYAYDERGADVDITKLPRARVQEQDLKPWEKPKGMGESDWALDPMEETPPISEEELAEEVVEEEEDLGPIPGEAVAAGTGSGTESRSENGEEWAEGDRTRRRRRRRRGRGGGPADGPHGDGEAMPAGTGERRRIEVIPPPAGRRPVVVPPGAARDAGAGAASNGLATTDRPHAEPVQAADGSAADAPRRGRRRRRGRGGGGGTQGGEAGVSGSRGAPGGDGGTGRDGDSSDSSARAEHVPGALPDSVPAWPVPMEDSSGDSGGSDAAERAGPLVLKPRGSRGGRGSSRDAGSRRNGVSAESPRTPQPAGSDSGRDAGSAVASAASGRGAGAMPEVVETPVQKKIVVIPPPAKVAAPTVQTSAPADQSSGSSGPAGETSGRGGGRTSSRGGRGGRGRGGGGRGKGDRESPATPPTPPVTSAGSTPNAPVGTGSTAPAQAGARGGGRGSRGQNSGGGRSGGRNRSGTPEISKPTGAPPSSGDAEGGRRGGHASAAASAEAKTPPTAKGPRLLYASRRRLSPSEISKLGPEG